jgi:hypothetical protein
MALLIIVVRLKTMYNILLRVYFRIKEMPLVLRIFIFPASCLGFLAFIGSLFPIGTYHVEGRQASYSEWWGSGNALMFIIFGVSLSLSSIGFFRKRIWASYLFIFALMIPSIWNYEKLTIDIIIASSGLFYFIIAIYLLYKESMQQYFRTD